MALCPYSSMSFSISLRELSAYFGPYDDSDKNDGFSSNNLSRC